MSVGEQHVHECLSQGSGIAMLETKRKMTQPRTILPFPWLAVGHICRQEHVFRRAVGVYREGGLADATANGSGYLVGTSEERLQSANRVSIMATLLPYCDAARSVRIFIGISTRCLTWSHWMLARIMEEHLSGVEVDELKDCLNGLGSASTRDQEKVCSRWRDVGSG
jgi:hypothetical protein